MPDTWRGADYARHSTLQAAMADEVLSRLPLRGYEQALDVDASADMVAHARQRFGGAAWPTLSFEVADARRLDFRPHFDKVVSFNALHWVPQQADALRGIRQALKAQGQAHLRL
jgi:trans-aconitate 2-methyltransferase